MALKHQSKFETTNFTVIFTENGEMETEGEKTRDRDKYIFEKLDEAVYE